MLIGFHFILLAVAVLTVPGNFAMADSKMTAPLVGRPDLFLNKPDSKKNIYYRRRVKALMHEENYLLRQWRERRSYPYVDRAMRMVREGNKRAALDVYNTYLAKDPKHLLMHWERLVLLGTMQAPSQTEAAASEFLRWVPDFGPALMLRAFARASLARMPEAESDWADAEKDEDLTPEDHFIVLGQLSFSAYQRGDFDAAMHWCRRLIAVKRDDVALSVFYAGLLEKMGHLQAAVDQWRRVAGMVAAGLVLRRSVLARSILLKKLHKSRAAFAVLMTARERGLFDGSDVPASQRLEFARMLAEHAAKAGRADIAVQALHDLPHGLLDDAARLHLARLYTLRAEPGRVIPVLFESPAVSLAGEDTLVGMLDLIRLLEREKFPATAADLMGRTLPSVRLHFREHRYAKAAQRLWKDYLAAHADISRRHGQWQSAAASLAQLARLTGDYRYQMDYAAVLLVNNRPGPAVMALKRAAGRTDLAPEQQARACAALAAVLSQCGRHAEAARAWHRAYLSGGYPGYGLYSSESYCKAGDLRSADGVLKKVLQSNPHDREALKRRAYIQAQLGNDAQAAALFEGWLRTGERNDQILADLGFAWARLGDNRRSLKFLRQAVDFAPDAAESGPVEQAPAPKDPLQAIRSQIAEMDRPLELTLSDSVHSVGQDTPRDPSSSDQWFNRGGGMLEAAFRPARLGYRRGRTLTFAGRLVWPNRPGTLHPEGDGLEAGIGFKYKPLRSTNLLLCSEYLLGIGEDRDNQVLLRIAHSSTHMPATARHGSASGLLKKITYRHHYTELGKTLGSDGYWFASHESRLGKAYFSAGKAWLLPFGYLLGDGVVRSGGDFFQVETGVGLSVRWSGVFGRYRGDRRQAECLLRGGYMLYTNDGSPGWSVLLGVRLSCF